MSSKKQNKIVEEDDDDSENDSDYNPKDDDEDVLAQSQSQIKDNQGLNEMSYARKRKVDDLWNILQDNEKKYKEEYHSKQDYLIPTNSMKKTQKKRNKNDKNMKILQNIFGKTIASELVNQPIISATSSNSLTQSNNDDETQRNELIKQRVKDSIGKILKKTKVIEKRKFAGQEIE